MDDLKNGDGEEYSPKMGLVWWAMPANSELAVLAITAKPSGRRTSLSK
jgi:hypothetical protein